jgi:hypothetical protein
MVQIFNYKQVSSEDPIYSMVAVINNSVLFINLLSLEYLVSYLRDH